MRAEVLEDRMVPSSYPYTLSDLGDLPGGADFSVALAVNGAGQVAGYSESASGERAFLWDSANGIRNLGTLPGANYSVGRGINASGQVVGESGGPSFPGEWHPYLWDPANGTMQDLGQLPGTANRHLAQGVNDAGQVVGYSSNHAYLWDPAHGMRDLGFLPGDSLAVASAVNNAGQAAGLSQVLGAETRHAVIWDAAHGTRDLGDLPGGIVWSEARAINGSGQAAGVSYAATGRRAFLWDSSGGMRNLGDLPGGVDESEAAGVNDAGQVVGYSYATAGQRAFVWDQTNGMRDLNDLVDPVSGWTLRVASAIGGSGHIVGQGVNASGRTHAFLLTPSNQPPKPDIALSSAFLADPTTLQFTYQTTGLPGPFTVSVFRSEDQSLDASDIPIVTTLVTAPSAPGGTEEFIYLGEEIRIDPKRPHILFVADPANAITETDEQNNTSSFRKLALAAVTHGFDLRGDSNGPPAWMDRMAKELTANGYDSVIEFDWTDQSNDPVPGRTSLAGTDLAEQMRVAAILLADQVNDVVDLRIIGHSRGAVVISQSLISLENDPGPESLRLGYYEMTMLDPHPARNRGSLSDGLRELASSTDGVSRVGSFSFDPTFWPSRQLARLTLYFQAFTHDPEVQIPSNVDYSEAYSQQLSWKDTPLFSSEQLTRFNLWGDPEDAILNPAERPLVYVDMNSFRRGHGGVIHWFIDNKL